MQKLYDPTEEKNLPVNNTRQKILGIDLGTTNSLIALSENSVARILGGIVPSVVEQGGHKVGSFKRFMGKGIKDVEATELEARNIDLTSSTDANVNICLGDSLQTPEQLSAVILRRLKEIAKQELNQEFEECVITVPAYFDDAARIATRHAARIAGLKVVRLVNEPTAALLAYGLKPSQEGIYLVYDLGGGTFDVSILKVNEGVFKVISTAGDLKLGGDDIDYLIAKNLIEKYLDQDEIKTDKSALEKIINFAKEIKEKLSTEQQFIYNLELEVNNSKKIIEIEFSQTELENLVDGLIQKTISLVKKAMRSAKISASDVNGVILVGGASRMPLIKEKLKNIFGARIYDDQNPDEIVAKGAAILAENLQTLSGNLLIDVAPLTIGIEIMGGIVDKIIEKNTSIPARSQVSFTTYADNQTGMSFHIVQGEREFAADCRSLCKFELKNIPPKPAGAIKIDVEFCIDADGILTISAEDKDNKLYQEIEVSTSFGITEQKIEEMVEDSLKNARADVSSRLRAEAVFSAQSFLSSLRKYVPDEQLTNEIKQQIILLETSIEKSPRPEILENLKKLEEISLPLIQDGVEGELSKAIKNKKFSEFS